MVKFYHGTSSVFLEEIKKHGLSTKMDGPREIEMWLTTERILAERYAKLKCDECGGEILIIEIKEASVTYENARKCVWEPDLEIKGIEAKKLNYVQLIPPKDIAF